jgi:hypothetical protein
VPDSSTIETYVKEGTSVTVRQKSHRSRLLARFRDSLLRRGPHADVSATRSPRGLKWLEGRVRFGRDHESLSLSQLVSSVA